MRLATLVTFVMLIPVLSGCVARRGAVASAADGGKSAGPPSVQGRIGHVGGAEIEVLPDSLAQEKSVARLAKDTQITTIYGGYVPLSDLVEGQRVRVWLTEPAKDTVDRAPLAVLIVIASEDPAVGWPEGSARNDTKATGLKAEDLYRIAKKAIVARAGNSFFDNYVTPMWARSYPPEDCQTCTEDVRRGYSLIALRFRMPELSFVDAIIDCVVRSNGSVSRLEGVPSCIKDPGECIFPYDEAAARAIAERAGLEPGLEPWKFHFHWHVKFEAYVWQVSNTLEEEKETGSGQLVLINANDGHVVGIYRWSRIT